ncbi:leukocyte receptor cluster member 9 [Biomphalaria glabrata]
MATATVNFVDSSVKTSKTTSDSPIDQSTEVAAVKAAFPNRCRIISDVKTYTNVLTVQPENMDVTIKFQLTAAYPRVIPDIAIRSESLTEENITDIQQSLRSKAKQLAGQFMLDKLIQEAETELRAIGLKPGKVITNAAQKQVKHKKNRTKKKKSEDEIDENQKLSPMKTADDVVKRIIWDDNLEKDDFIVGYLDRFKGLLEKSFSSFSWEDLASVDYDVLAVPKHRIQYFKYKDIKVWDKLRRIDNVFGSAEGTKTIDVVIKEWEELESLPLAGLADASYTKQETSSNSEEDDSEDDSDEDDGIQVTIGSSANIGTGVKSRVSNYENVKLTEENENDIENGFNPYWRDKLRPNYFLCIRITNEAIIDQICNIQDRFMEFEPLFSDCCIPGNSLHITLNTLGLDTPEQLLQCIEALKRIQPEIVAAVPKSSLKLHGVSNFYNRVIYAKVHYKEDFLEFCSTLKTLLSEAGVQIRDGYEFVPHVTIMKTTRPVSRLRGTKNVNPVIYAKYADTYFGEQSIEGIYLCAMGDERRDDGFYVTPHELHFKS